MNPDVQTYCLDHHRRALMGEAPTLATVRLAYGRNIAETWVILQMRAVEKYCGAQTKLDSYQIEEFARATVAQWGHLKTSELALFFAQLKTGAYGHFFGSIDPQRVGESLREFEVKRRQDKARYEDEEGRERRRLAAELHEALADAFLAEASSYGLTPMEYAELGWLFNMGYERKDFDR